VGGGGHMAKGQLGTCWPAGTGELYGGDKMQDEGKLHECFSVGG